MSCQEKLSTIQAEILSIYRTATNVNPYERTFDS
jgi:hypothetical protein